ncbi:unnamed protein product [Ranitomeya imitator]|uniref:Uncharacterized protein n=1 Tax=Ranitomeya imitator TaxID=111125 RepID=A0ABN9L0E0_9NEOB|nr:unnamed protein product [Ranitomeya imitator]
MDRGITNKEGLTSLIRTSLMKIQTITPQEMRLIPPMKDNDLPLIVTKDLGKTPQLKRLQKKRECIEEDLIELKKKSSCNHNRPNLSKLERKALEEIRGNQDLMVRRADKGGAVVLLNAGLYVQQNMVMLNNSNTYRRLQHDPTELFQKKLKHLLSEGFAIGALDKKLSEDLFVEHPIIPIFHSLPKIHKEVFPPTFRPIVAGIGSMGENLSTWVDMYLQPLISRLPGYIKDSQGARELSREVNFVPTNNFNCFEWVKDLNLFCRKLKWQKFFKHNTREECHELGLSDEDFEGYEALRGLLQENDHAPGDGKGPFTTLKNKSVRMPPQGDTGNIELFALLVERDL